jgi:hypothetical protein
VIAVVLEQAESATAVATAKAALATTCLPVRRTIAKKITISMRFLQERRRAARI